MPHQLKDLEIKEISFVTKGASGNSKITPRIVFWKGQNQVSKSKKPTMIDRLTSWFAKADEPRTPEAMLADLKAQLSDEQQDILMLLLAAAKAAPADSSAAPVTPEPEPEPTAEKADDMPAEDEAEKAEDEAEELIKLAKDNPEIAARIEKLQSEARSARDESAALRKDLNSEVQKRRDAEYLEKAKTFTFLPGDHVEVAKLLEAADRKLTGGEQDTLAKLLKTTAGIVEKSELFTEKGDSRPSDDDGGTASKLDAAITEIMKADKTLKRPQAFRKALADNPELRAEINGANHANVSLGR